MAARVIANLIVLGSGILGRAVMQAYRQALSNASKSGVAQETMQNIRRGSKIIVEPEARQILGVTEHSSLEEILKESEMGDRKALFLEVRDKRRLCSNM